MKCSYCSMNAVVIDNSMNGSYGAYCAGHAVVYLKKMTDAAKLDKFDFRAVSELTELSGVNCRLCDHFIPSNYGVCASVVKCVDGNRFDPMLEVRLYNA